MGIFDSIKDALTTDNAEQYEIAEKNLEKATAELEKARAEVGTAADPRSRERIEKAEQGVRQARGRADELAAKAGLNVPDPAAESAAAEARAREEAQAQADADAIRNVEAMKARASEQQPTPAEEPATAEPEAVPAEAAPAEEPAPAEELAAAEPEAPAEPDLRTHTVKKGDTLSEIGQHYGVKWRDIAALNDIKNPDRIYPGQVFRIPNA